MNKIYSKKIITVGEQIKLLTDRGLIIDDLEKTKRILSAISYYHISIYFKHFQNEDDSFIAGTHFKEVWDIYVFDQKLRLLLLGYLEQIEQSFKTSLIRDISTTLGTAHWLSDETHFRDKYNYQSKTQSIIDGLKSSKELYLQSYFEKYQEPTIPPSWMVFESLTFGQSVMIYRQLDIDFHREIAKRYYLPYITIGKWMYPLTLIRNICAHHSRLWNREMTTSLHLDIKGYNQCFSTDRPNRLFNYLVVMQILLYSFRKDTSFVEKIDDLVTEYNINISHMGFPDDWKLKIKKTKEIFIKRKENYEKQESKN